MIFKNDSFKTVLLKQQKNAWLLRAVHVSFNYCTGHDRLEMLQPLRLLTTGTVVWIVRVTVMPCRLPSGMQIGKGHCHFHTFVI